jgi:Glycosyl transferases group 1
MAAWIRKYATHVLSCSRAALASISLPGKGPPVGASVLPNGIDLRRYAVLASQEELRYRLGLAPSARVLAHVGRFSPVKNHRFTIDLFADLSRMDPNWRLVLVGDGPEQGAILERARACGIIDRVAFLGIRSDIPELLGAFDVFVYPSFHEGLPIALVEAQAAGLPCLVSDRVTQEADLSVGLMSFLPIDSGPHMWAQSVLRAYATQRPSWEQRNDALGRAGYDILKTTQTLFTIYASAAAETMRPSSATVAV